MIPALNARQPSSSPIDSLASKTEKGIDVFEIESPIPSDEDVALPLTRLQFTLDNTIVSTALRSIILDLGRQDLAPWIGSAYMITSAGLATLYGKFADIFGRKIMFIFAMIAFELGSLICGMAGTVETLIVGRALAGVGGGGIGVLVLIIISDIVPLRERAKWQSVMGAGVGVASILGPVVGGIFSDNLSWRWCFYINIPFGILIILCFFSMKFNIVEGNALEKIKRVDWFGIATLFGAIVCFVTPLLLGGTIWEWNSAPVLILLPLSVAQDPIVPPKMFVNLNYSTSFFSAVYFISLFFQVAGVATIPLVLGMVTTTMASGILVTKTGKYTLYFYLGPVFLIVGTALMSLLNSESYVVERVFYLLIFGFGAGFIYQTRVVALQSSVPTKYIAVVTALATTCLLLGGAIGIAVTGSVFNNLVDSSAEQYPTLTKFVDGLQKQGYPASTTEVLGLLSMIHKAAEKFPTLSASATEATSQLIASFNSAYKIAYLSLLPYPIIMLCLAFFVRQMTPDRPEVSKPLPPLPVEEA
ncbi:major facilitator superfamily domain-containing protein [Obelidium mucronatum]|nr:major facilitator superfamily domain-containing protein [Obelidium mucronatum]